MTPETAARVAVRRPSARDSPARSAPVFLCLRGLGLVAPGFFRSVHLPRNDTGRRRDALPDIC